VVTKTQFEIPTSSININASTRVIVGTGSGQPTFLRPDP
jgi:hypothetical protein